MPCRYYTDEEEAAMARGEISSLKQELDGVTCLLCDVMKSLTDKQQDTLKSRIKGLTAWAERHRRRDDARIAKEKADQEKATQARLEEEKVERKIYEELKRKYG